MARLKPCRCYKAFENLQGLKPNLNLRGLMARLKPCRCYKAFENLQGLKPNSLVAFFGTTEVMP